MVDAAVEGLHSLDGDLGVVDVFGDEARAVPDGQHGVLQQRMVLHKLQSLIGQLEGRVDVLHAVQVIDALKYIINSSSRESNRSVIIRLTLNNKYKTFDLIQI